VSYICIFSATYPAKLRKWAATAFEPLPATFAHGKAVGAPTAILFFEQMSKGVIYASGAWRGAGTTIGPKWDYSWLGSASGTISHAFYQ
jgi:hypothetical protein